MFIVFIYIQNQWTFLKKEMHVYKLSLCIFNQILGLLQHSVSSGSHVCMDWEKKRFYIWIRFYWIRQQFEQRNYFSSFLHWINYIDCTWIGSWVWGGILLSAFLSSCYIWLYHYLSNFQLFACIFNFLCRLSFLFNTDVFLEKFQKGFLAPSGGPRRLFTRSNAWYGWNANSFNIVCLSSYLQVCWWSDQKYRRNRIHNISSGAQGSYRKQKI